MVFGDFYWYKRNLHQFSGCRSVGGLGGGGGAFFELSSARQVPSRFGMLMTFFDGPFQYVAGLVQGRARFLSPPFPLGLGLCLGLEPGGTIVAG